MKIPKWYQKPVGVGFLLWLFFPVGLYFMWKEKVWTSKTRIIITSVLSLFIILALAGEKSDDSIPHSDIQRLSGLTFVYEETGVVAILEFDNDKECGYSAGTSDFNMVSLGKYFFNENSSTITFSWEKIGPKKAKAIIKNNNIVELVVEGPSGNAVYKLLTN